MLILTKQIKGQQQLEILRESLGERQDDYAGEEAEYHVREEEDEAETTCCVKETIKDEWWRRRLKQTMYQYGYDKHFVENLVRRLQTEEDGTEILSQLAVVVACSQQRT